MTNRQTCGVLILMLIGLLALLVITLCVSADCDKESQWLGAAFSGDRVARQTLSPMVASRAYESTAQAHDEADPWAGYGNGAARVEPQSLYLPML